MPESVTESNACCFPRLVLVVDDRVGVLRLAEKVLRSDASVLTASRGSHAIAILREAQVAVVVCDLEMPAPNGLDVLRATRRLRPAASFVLMTAGRSVASAAEAKRLGADDLLHKPFEPEALRSAVERAFQTSLRLRANAAEEVGITAGEGPMSRSHAGQRPC